MKKPERGERERERERKQKGGVMQNHVLYYRRSTTQAEVEFPLHLIQCVQYTPSRESRMLLCLFGKDV